MAGSTLDPDNLPLGGKQDKAAPGHDTKSLGPSDSSDSGSDMAGPGLIDEETLNLERGTNEDAEGGVASSADAGPSVGDAGMNDDSDRYGTGERRAAGKDPRGRASADVDTDRVVGPDEAGVGAGLDQAEEARLGVTDEEIERALGLERAPFEVGDETQLRATPRPAARARPPESPQAKQPAAPRRRILHTKWHKEGKR